MTGAPRTADALHDLVDECRTAGIERQALLLRLSLLPRAFTKPHHLRLARATLAPLLQGDRAGLYHLSALTNAADGLPSDLVVVWRGPAEAAVQACRAEVAALFADAAVADLHALTEMLLLPHDADVLLATIEAARPAPTALPSSSTMAALDTVSLATLEARLACADMARFARRRDVCALEGGRFALRWEKRFLSVAELTETLAPDRALQADPWLFRRLTRTLDRRMLALLAAPGELRGVGPFSLNLNIGSILSPEFLRLDAALPGQLRNRVVLDLLPADVLADPSAFLFARDFAQARGYRLLLRSITAELLDVLPLALCGLDLLQLRWSPGLLTRDSLPSDASRIVLARADTPEAIAWGEARGIGLFAGSVVARGGRRPAAVPSRASVPVSRKRALGGVIAPA